MRCASLARSFSQEGWETLVKMMRNAGLPGNVRIKAYEAVLNRGIGLPAVAIDVTVQRGNGYGETPSPGRL
jgi:hypothetical protein